MKTRAPAFVQVNADYYVRISAITEVWLSAGDKENPPVWRFRLSTTPVDSRPSQFYAVGANYEESFTKLVSGAPEEKA